MRPITPKCYFMVSFAAVNVFFMSMAIVMGPTPPGTGVIAAAFSFTSSKATSPTSFHPFRFREPPHG